MKRRFNYTKRRKLPRSQVALAWKEPSSPSEPPIFFGTIDPTLDPPLPSDAEIYLEAYSGAINMRFFCGTVAKPSLSEENSLHLFAPGQSPLFRVKVTAPNDPLKTILARADSVSPMSPDDAKAGRISILPVERVDLGDLLWKVSLDDINQPKLQLNKTVTEPRDIATMANDGDFIALAYPAVIREILTAVLSAEEAEDDHPWIEFGARLAGIHPPDEDDFPLDDNEELIKEQSIWIDSAVQGFASHFEAKRNFITHKTLTENHV
jgi:hypothetical protein